MLKLELMIVISMLMLSAVGCSRSTNFSSSDPQTTSKSSGSGGDTASSCPSAEGGTCVAICHIPPGNPDARHTIWVGRPAVRTHVDHHGDFVGTCEGGPSENPDPDEGGGTDPGDGGDGGDGGGTPPNPDNLY